MLRSYFWPALNPNLHLQPPHAFDPLLLRFAESSYCYKITRIVYRETIKTNPTFAMILVFHSLNSFIVDALKYPYGWSPSHSKRSRTHKTKEVSQCDKIAAWNTYSWQIDFLLPTLNRKQKPVFHLSWFGFPLFWGKCCSENMTSSSDASQWKKKEGGEVIFISPFIATPAQNNNNSTQTM